MTRCIRPFAPKKTFQGWRARQSGDVACSKHPSSLVGVWKSGEAGFLSAEVVFTQKSDGTAKMSAGSMLGGSHGEMKWGAAGDKLITTETNGAVPTFTVVSKSKTDLVLQPADGSLLSFRRIGD